MMSELQEFSTDNQEKDKENIFQNVEETFKDLIGSEGGKRMPLQVMNSAGDGVRPIVYSPVTPVSVSHGRSPHSGKKARSYQNCRRTSFSGQKSQLNLFNTLVFNKAKKVIEQAVQVEKNKLEQVEEFLRQKEEEIVILKAEISRLGGSCGGVGAYHVSFEEPASEERFAKTDVGADFQKLVSRLAVSDEKCSLFCIEISSLKNQLSACQLELAQQTSAASVDCEQRIQAAIQESKRQQQQEISDLNNCIAKLKEELSLITRLKKQETELCNEYRIQSESNFKLRRDLEAQLSHFMKPQLSKTDERLTQIQERTRKSGIPMLLPKPNSRVSVSKHSVALTVHCNAKTKVTEGVGKTQQVLSEDKKKFELEREEFIKQKVEWLEWKNEKEESLSAAAENYELVSKVNAEHRIQEKRLRDCLSEAESKINDLSNSITCLESRLKDENEKTDSLTDRLNAAEQIAQDTKEKLMTEIERHELEVINLQRTVDMREHEYDDLMKERNNFQNLVKGLRAQITKYQSIISKVADLELQIKLLEQEKMAVCNEVLDVKKKLTESTKNLQQVTTDFKTIECDLSLERNEVELLRHSLNECSETLMLRDAELAKAMNCVDLLHRKAAVFFEKLVSQWQSWNKVSESGKLTETNPHRRKSATRISSSRRRSSRGNSSFLCQIISASKRSFASDSRSASEADVAEEPKSAAADPCSHNGLFRLNDVFPDLLDVQVTPKQSLRDPNCSHQSGAKSASVGDCLTSTVDSMTDIFSKMELILIKEVAVTFTQMRCQIKNLEHCLDAAEKSHTKVNRDSEAALELLRSEYKQMELKAQFSARRCTELELDLSRHVEQLNELKSMFNNQMDYLTERSQQKIEIQKLSTDLGMALNKCKTKEEEIQSLKSLLNDRLLGEGSASERNMAAIINDLNREISQLKTQRQNMLFEKLDEKKSSEMLVYRLKEQNRILTQKLMSAEDAIAQMDTKIESIRKALQPHADLLKKDEELNKILNEILVFN